MLENLNFSNSLLNIFSKSILDSRSTYALYWRFCSYVFLLWDLSFPSSCINKGPCPPLSFKKKKTQIPNFELKRHVSYMDCGAFRLHNKFFFQNNFFKVYNHKLLKFTYTLFIGFYFWIALLSSTHEINIFWWIYFKSTW